MLLLHWLLPSPFVTAPFVTSHLLFGPFLDNVHVYGPIFAEASRLSLSGAAPYYLPDIGTGFPLFVSPHFCILYPFYFLGLINYGGPLNSLYTLTYLTLFHLFIFYVNLYVLLRCGTVPPWAAVSRSVRRHAGAEHGNVC